MFQLFAILTIVTSVIFTGCFPKPKSLGNEGSIVIIADPVDRPLLTAAIDRTFGRLIETPQDEPLFSISYIDADELENKTRSPLLLLFASIDSDGSTAKFARSMIEGEIMEGVTRGEYFIFRRQNQWADNQLFLILLGRNNRDLAINTEEWIDTMLAWSIDFERNRLEKEMFGKGPNKEIERRLADLYGYNLRIPPDYLIAEENDSLNFVRVLRHYPDRWLLIGERPAASPESLTADYLYRWRKALAPTFLDPVATYDDHWTCDTTYIAGYPALKIHGLWQTIDPTGGGPFFTYGFWLDNSKRFIIIDGAVFAPGNQKMPYLWQLEVMSHSFSYNSHLRENS